MAFKCIVFLAVLAYANAGNLLAAPIAHYSPASAVSSSYFQSNALHPVAATYAAAPVATAYAAAPVAVHDQHIGSSSQSVVRSLGGNQAISQYSKAVDSAFSSVRKYDTRITNDALSYAAAPVIAKTYAASLAPAPLLKTYAAPLAPAPLLKTYAAPLAPAPLIAKTYAAPVAAPVVAKAAIAYSPATVVSHMTFSGLGVEYGW